MCMQPGGLEASMLQIFLPVIRALKISTAPYADSLNADNKGHRRRVDIARSPSNSTAMTLSVGQLRFGHVVRWT